MHFCFSQCWQTYISRFGVQLFRKALSIVVIPFYTKPPLFVEWNPSADELWEENSFPVSRIQVRSPSHCTSCSGSTSRDNSSVPLDLIVHNYELKQTFNKTASCTLLLPGIMIYYVIKYFGQSPDTLCRNLLIIAGRNESILLFGENVKSDYFKRFLGLTRLYVS
jgi:hypothetical protein